MNFFFRKTIWMLLAAFLISVAIRVPNLNRPLSKHHEFCTSFALIILQSWYDGGIASYGFNPSITYPNKTSEYIDKYGADYMQRDGKYFYISHPPLAYYLPYFTFLLLNIYPDALAIQVFNLIFHFLTTLILYLIVRIITGENAKRQFSRAGFLASLFYLFMPATLWFNSNVYMSDMFVQNTWIVCLYFILKILFQSKETSVPYLIWFGVTLFLMMYTDWLGAFFATSVALVCGQKIFIKKDRRFISLLIITVFAVLFSTAAILFQYSTIAGWSAMMKYFIFDYNVMGVTGLHPGLGIFQIVTTLFFNYAVSYLPLLLFLGVALYLIWRNKLQSSVSREKFFLVTWLTAFPVLLDHLIFPAYSPQDFSVLKASFFLCIASGILLSDLRSTPQLSPLKRGSRRGIIIAFSICVTGITMYYYINRPGEYSYKGDRYDLEKNIGTFIRSNANEDEVAFCMGLDVTPQVIYYAHRQVRNVNTQEDALAFLAAHHFTKGIMFTSQNDSLHCSRILQ